LDLPCCALFDGTQRSARSGLVRCGRDLQDELSDELIGMARQLKQNMQNMSNSVSGDLKVLLPSLSGEAAHLQSTCCAFAAEGVDQSWSVPPLPDAQQH
jgi:hypothetical protein